MPVQNTDSDTTWFIDQADKKWILAKNATITVDGQIGIYEAVSGSDIMIKGDIVASGATSGIYFQGSNSSVEIARSSVVDASQAEFGIHAAGAGSDIVNRGTIRGGDTAVYGNIWADVKNYGKITGAVDGMTFVDAGSQIYNYGKISGNDTGLTTDAEGSYLLNAKGALISGDQVGVLVRDLGDMTLANRGTIRSEAFAIESENNDLTIRNTGKIIGDVALGGGDDMLDTRGGSVKGVIYGGDGDDALYTNSSKIKLQEEANGGEDRVMSSVSYTLGANIENMLFFGKKDIDATGNDEDNTIFGNVGDNVISGMGGNDIIAGGSGDDSLRGGAGNDVFFFASSNDIDRVKDFTDGQDRLTIDGVETIADFDDLDIKQVKDDVIINLGSGDKLIIENMVKSDITFDDIFVF